MCGDMEMPEYRNIRDLKYSAAGVESGHLTY